MARWTSRKAPSRCPVLPAHAGMARSPKAGTSLMASFSPHTRGWPDPGRQKRIRDVGSPRTRGDGPAFDVGPSVVDQVLPAHAGMARPTASTRWRRRLVLPAHAGMARSAPSSAGLTESSPRTRGDGPATDRGWNSNRRPFSPHTRGWPVHVLLGALAQHVLPAHAGMARDRRPSRRRGSTFSPHTRGWPAMRPPPYPSPSRSPRTRGDGPGDVAGTGFSATVLPAHAGMARWRASPRAPRPTFSPHTRGWPAPTLPRLWWRGSFSPHTRGWPEVAIGHRGSFDRSPRTRGDGPLPALRRRCGSCVLPAHAGMAR